MTYVSRRTRITVSRWPDECDVEYILKASRKRSDGRLKRHTSCDDHRAWINDNCIRHEYLVDLMSNGEYLGKPFFQLYGRFIPVPILFKLTQTLTIQNGETNSYENREENVTNVNPTPQEKYSESTSYYAEEYVIDKDDNRSGNSKAKSDFNLITTELEKNALEKTLVRCTCLLNRALGKLEQIDDIVGIANDNARNEEIQEAFYNARLSCTCSQKQNSSFRSSSFNFYENPSCSKDNLNMEKAKRTRLLRKISELRKKLKKIFLQEINLKIQSSQHKFERRSNDFRTAELNNCPDQAQILVLKKYKKLKAEKDRLVSKICRAFTLLNSMKKTNSYSESGKRNSLPNGNYSFLQKNELKEFENCNCGCKCSENLSDSGNREYFESSSAKGDSNKKFEELGRSEENFCSDCETTSTDFHFRSSHDSGRHSDGNLSSASCTKTYNVKSTASKPKHSINSSNHHQQPASLPEIKSENSKDKVKASETVKKSKIRFACKESPCRKNTYVDDLSAFKSSPSKEMIILKAVNNIQYLRPNTTPVTKREKQDCQNFTDEHKVKLFENIPERRVKSEATMKDIEKTLRNYEQRLSNIESLEFRVEQLKEKSSEAWQLRKTLKKVKADAKKQRAVDRENSNRERTRLCSENYELKKKVERLTKRSVAQNCNIQNLNCIIMKLECETVELKKELSEYQVGFEHQQKYIAKCECTLAKWGAEIESLKSHIRKLTAIKESPCSPCQDNRCIQRSRSYSPEKIRDRISITRARTQSRGYRTPSEEDISCCSRDYDQLRGSRSNRQRLLLPMRQKM